MPKRKFSAIPIDPNETGSDPQFGNIEDLPRGVKRQTSVILMDGQMTSKTTDRKNWSRLVFSFPECLGIKETLDNAAKSTSCIPSVSMDVPINLPVVRNCRVDIIRASRPEWMDFKYDKTNSQIEMNNREQNMAFILTGDDQLTKAAPSTTEEDKSEDSRTASQMAALSDTIYARFKTFLAMDQYKDAIISGSLNPAEAKGTGWVYGKTIGGIEGIDYAQVAQRYMNPTQNSTEACDFEINNIQPKGHLLLKDHVNMFVRLPQDLLDTWEVRVILDYSIKQVSLSSLLVWQQQLTEFIPKEVRWRIYSQAQADDKNGWNILISRGNVTENGTGSDPTSKTAFPDIKD